MTRYIALIDGKKGAYGVTVPDLPGCTSAGKTTDEALRNAVEAVRMWAEDAAAQGEANQSAVSTGFVFAVTNEQAITELAGHADILTNRIAGSTATVSAVTK